MTILFGMTWTKTDISRSFASKGGRYDCFQSFPLGLVSMIFVLGFGLGMYVGTMLGVKENKKGVK